MRKEYVEILRHSFLLESTSDELFDDIISSLRYVTADYSRGEIIFSPDTFEKKVGFVIKGECDVFKACGNTLDVRINSIGVGGTFGIVGALSDHEEFPTIVRAKVASTILFVDGQDLYLLMGKYPSVTRNIIEFFAERIRFLNERIATFSEGTVEEKLAHYLLRQCREVGNVSFPFNKQKTAQTLGVGRASLYRALGSLSASKFIQYDNKILHIIDREGLERIIK
ncbi:MAG: Crp/Fnr family transcriptional regulator [Clostridia bacterium]|nr:Crp/Fnr family transcriptional regulator [Clostridia bacterium]